MRLTCLASAIVIAHVLAQPAAAQTEPAAIELVVNAGRPLRVALDDRVELKRVGQPVTATVIEPVYAYDRVVVESGAKVRGQVARIDSGSKIARARAYLAGNFAPDRRPVVQFTTLVLADGREVAIDTIANGGIPRVTRRTASEAKKSGVSAADEPAAGTPHPTLTSRARAQVKQQTSDAILEAKQKAREALTSIKPVKQPGQLRRLKDAAIQQLPYHRQYLAKGTVYDAELASPISFGTATPTAMATSGTLPAPDSILMALLVTRLDSSKTPRGTLFEAVVRQTVFSADHLVVLPEGTKLLGEVTFAKSARRFHRNGQLRFLFERVQIPNRETAPLLGALHAIEANDEDRVTVDEEGGTTFENSKARFVAPAISLLALHASIEGDGHRYADPDGDGSIETAGSGAGSRALGGFIGMGVLGTVAGQVTRPAGIALSAYGFARKMYSNVLGKGREVVFLTGTPIEVRLAPGPIAR